MEKIPCSVLLRKLKTFEDRVNFARELGKIWILIFRVHSSKGERIWCPILSKVFKGRKKGKTYFYFLLVITYRKYGGFNFRYFSKSQNFTKSHILHYFMENEELQQFIPDDICPNNLSREYLLSVCKIHFYIIFLYEF